MAKLPGCFVLEAESEVIQTEHGPDRIQRYRINKYHPTYWILVIKALWHVASTTNLVIRINDKEL